MSSNESVERMLKQLENLLRQQDKDQRRETGAEPEAVAADGGSPVLSEEQGSGDIPPAPVVEVTDNVEMVPSEEDWREIGESERAEAGVNLEQVSAASETQVEVDTHRRRFGIGDLLNLSNHDEEQTAEEGLSVQEALVPATDNGQAELADDEPREVSADVLVGAPGEMVEPRAAGDTLSASTPRGETGAEELPVSAEGIINAEAEAELVPPAGDVQEGLQASPESSADTEPSEDAESPASKYPSWWFRGGSVHKMEDGEDVGTPNGTGYVDATDDRPNLEPFVHREPEVGPLPARKLISEQLQEEELAAEQLASAESAADQAGGTPGEVIIGIEGLNAVPAPPDAVPDEEPEVAEVIEDASEDAVDPARALKIVESFAEVAVPQDAGAAEEVAHIAEAAHAAEIEVVAETAPSDEVAAHEVSLADGESASIDEIVVQDEDSAMEGGAVDGEVTDPIAGGPQIPVIIDVEGSIPPEVEPGPVPPMAEQPAAKQPEVEIPQAEVPEIMATNAEVPPVELLESETPQQKIPDSPIESTPAAESTSERPRRRLTARLGTLLLDAHLISGRDLERALEEHQVTGERLGHYLVDKGMVDEKDLAAVLSDQYGVPAADVENMAVPAVALMSIPEKMARRRMVLPLAVGEGVIEVAMINPSDIAAIKDIEFITGLRVQPLIVTEWALERAIQRLYSSEDLRSARLSGGSAKSTGLTDPKAIIRRMVRDRDEAVMQSERDPQSAYELAASIDEFVGEILKAVEKLGE